VSGHIEQPPNGESAHHFRVTNGPFDHGRPHRRVAPHRSARGGTVGPCLTAHRKAGKPRSVSKFYFGAAALTVTLYALGIGDAPGSILPAIVAFIMGGVGVAS
jgi:hypothetical protein